MTMTRAVLGALALLTLACAPALAAGSVSIDVQEHRLDTGSRGRSSRLLEPLPEGIQAVKTYGEDQS